MMGRININSIGWLLFLALSGFFLLAGNGGGLSNIEMNIISEYSEILLPDTRERVIVFRHDDIGPEWSDDSAIYITEIFRKRNVPHVISVVPLNIGGMKLYEDSVIADYLRSIKDDESIEFALHGYDHSFHEFEDIALDGSSNSAMYKITDGSRILEDVVGAAPVSFVPPYGVYNDNTLAAMKSGGSMNIMSSCPYDINKGRAFGKVDGIMYLPATVFFYNWEGDHPNSADEITGSCEYTLGEFGACVITLHHHKFLDSRGNMDPEKVQVLIDVIEWAKSKEEDGEARIVRLKDIFDEDLL